MTLRGKIPSLDGLRAIAIFLVLISHMGRSYEDSSGFCIRIIKAFQLGGLGVTIFFVLSGFLITTLLLEERAQYQGVLDIRAFYFRRILRIFPVFYLYVAVVYILVQQGYVAATPRDFIRALTYTANLGVGAWALGHAWSLAVEEQFYLFWPWLVRLSKKVMVFSALIIIVYASSARQIGYRWPFLEPYLFLPLLRGPDCLMVGALWGILMHGRPSFYEHPLIQSKALRWVCFAALLVLRYAAYNGFMAENSFSGKFVRPFHDAMNAVLIGYLLLSFVAVKNDIFFRFLNHPAVVQIGILSYSLYVWQELFLDEKAATVWWRMFPANILCVFAAASLSYYLWERPILKWRDRFKKV